MAILAKKSGLMISGRVIEETDNFVCFHATDNKRPTYVQKSDKTQKVFDGDFSIEDVFTWINSARVKK
ncbi:hypothetical protein U9Z36_21200 [Escherichia coli]